MRFSGVPAAIIWPLTTTRTPAPNCTVTPGSTTRVVLTGIVWLVLITIGLLLKAQTLVTGGGGASRYKSATWIKSLLVEEPFSPRIARVCVPEVSQLVA